MATKSSSQKGIIKFDYLKALDKIDPKILNKLFIIHRGGSLDHVNNNSDWYRINNTNFLVNVYLDHDKNKMYILSISKADSENTIENGMESLDIGGKKKYTKKKSPGRPKLKESEDDAAFECDYSDVDEYGGAGKKKKSGRKPKGKKQASTR